jgi:hypothetical protein
MSVFYKGGRAGTKPISIKVPQDPQKYAKGGLANDAKKVANAGVGGDTLIIHINRQEYEQLKKEWGEPTINPNTGMPQFTPFWKQSWFAPVASIAASLLAPGLGTAIGSSLLGAIGADAGASILGTTAGSLLGSSVLGGGLGALSGGGKGALVGAGLGALGNIAATNISNAFGAGSTAGGVGGASGAGTTASGQSSSGGVGGWLGSLFGGSSGAASQLIPLEGPNALGNAASVGAYGPQIPAGAVTGAGATAAGMPSSILGALSKPSVLLPAAVLGAAALGGMGGSAPKTAAVTAPTSSDPNLTKPLGLTALPRMQIASMTPEQYYSYGYNPEQQFFSNNQISTPTSGGTPTVTAARGGAMPAKGPLSSIASRAVHGPGTGRSDDIPARLSDGEYVMDAETVSMLGDGSSKAGAEKLDQFRANIRKQKGKALAKGDFSPNAKQPEKYLKGGRA